jgi:uncharacterized delta-60 repeat protein
MVAGAGAARADGEVDLRFGVFGITDVPPLYYDDATDFRTMVVQPDGRIVVFGVTEGEQSVYGLRLEADGRMDPEFYFEDYWGGESLFPVGAAVLPDGRIFLAAERFDGVETTLLAWMMLEDGTWDAGFGDGGWEIYDPPSAADGLRAVSLGPGDTLLLGSHGYNPSPFVERTQIFVTRLLYDGSPDPTWSFSGHRAFDWRAAPHADDVSYLGAMELDPGGNLVVAGMLLNSTLGTDHVVVGRIGTGGGFDSGFGTAGRTFLQWPDVGFGDPTYYNLVGVRRSPLGGYLIGANFYLPDYALNRFGLARLTDLGGLDSTFSLDGFRYGEFDATFESESSGASLAVDAGGCAVVAGSYYEVATGQMHGLARFLPDGQNDPALGFSGYRTYQLNLGSLPDGTHEMALQDGGGILLAGEDLVSDHAGGLVRTMVVLRIDAGLAFTDSFETGDFQFWDGP